MNASWSFSALGALTLADLQAQASVPEQGQQQKPPWPSTTCRASWL
jgi:hypothetical protein